MGSHSYQEGIHFGGVCVRMCVFACVHEGVCMQDGERFLCVGVH